MDGTGRRCQLIQLRAPHADPPILQSRLPQALARKRTLDADKALGDEGLDFSFGETTHAHNRKGGLRPRCRAVAQALNASLFCAIHPSTGIQPGFPDQRP
jgi:hypothetical protein